MSGLDRHTLGQQLAHLRLRDDRHAEFPRLVGYRYQMPTEQLRATFDASSILELSTRDVALRTQLDPIVALRYE